MPCALLAASTVFAVPAFAGYAEDVGYSVLQAELGASTPLGAGVAVSQVEAPVQVEGQPAWMPDVTLGEFAGKTITNASGAPAGLFSRHATTVGQVFYGALSSISPAIDVIAAYGAEHWLGPGLVRTGSPGRPASSTSRIVNHSWVGNADEANGEILRRIDWLAETDDVVLVVGVGAATKPLLAGAYNAVVPAPTVGHHPYSTIALDETYVAGRVRPDVVVPAPSPSNAAGCLSSAVALLIETGHGDATLSTDPDSMNFVNRAGILIRNAERVEVIRAALMAGADRVTRNSTTGDLRLYRAAGHRTVNGLDDRYGAGQLNVRNSHRIIASGEQNSTQDGGPGPGPGGLGFDYDPEFGGAGGSNSTASYPLPVAPVPRLLTAALVVNLDIDGGTQSVFDDTARFRDLALKVVDVSVPGTPVEVLESQSTIDATENAWLVVPAHARYELRVTRVGTSSFNHDYALAWQLLPDSDADGAHDGQDNCILVANGPLTTDAGGNSQLDADGDGYGNACDADFDGSGTVNFTDLAAFRAAFGSGAAAVDLDGSGSVNFADLAIFRELFGRPPGPSAYAP